MAVLWLIVGVCVGAGAVYVLLAGRLAHARAETEHERALGAERLATVNDAQERLSSSFKAMSAEAVQAGMAQLAEMSRAQLATAQAEAKGESAKTASAGSRGAGWRLSSGLSARPARSSARRPARS
jgi:hypothetical protein